jgi:hypothetical protein
LKQHQLNNLHQINYPNQVNFAIRSQQYFKFLSIRKYTLYNMASSPRIFVTGVSGYVGGHLMGRLIVKHPEWHVAVLVRTGKQKSIVLGRWPQLEIVIGDLDDTALMIKDGSKADVVLRGISSGN